MPNPTGPRRVHLPWGYLPSGKRVRAACSCGWITTPRVDKRRALDALLSEHGYTDPVCATCETDHSRHSWDELRNKVIEIMRDPSRDEEWIMCRGMPRS